MSNCMSGIDILYKVPKFYIMPMIIIKPTRNASQPCRSLHRRRHFPIDNRTNAALITMCVDCRLQSYHFTARPLVIFSTS